MGGLPIQWVPFAVEAIRERPGLPHVLIPGCKAVRLLNSVKLKDLSAAIRGSNSSIRAQDIAVSKQVMPVETRRYRNLTT